MGRWPPLCSTDDEPVRAALARHGSELLETLENVAEAEDAFFKNGAEEESEADDIAEEPLFVPIPKDANPKDHGILAGWPSTSSSSSSQLRLMIVKGFLGEVRASHRLVVWPAKVKVFLTRPYEALFPEEELRYHSSRSLGHEKGLFGLCCGCWP